MVTRRMTRALVGLLIAAAVAGSTAHAGTPVPQESTAGAREAAAKSVPARSASLQNTEDCLVCGGPAGPNARTELVKGRRVTVCSAACADYWHAHQDELFAKLQARGALFDEEALSDAKQPRELEWGWMLLGSWVLAGLVCGAAATYVALSKGIAPVPWLLGALAFNVIALGLLLTRPRGDLSRLPEGVPAGMQKIPSTSSPVACAKCGRHNHPTAQVCTGCGEKLSARFESETARALRPPRA